MNPFTRFLRSQLGKALAPEVRDFADRWDRLEALIIHVYRAGVADREAEAAFAELRGWLVENYPRMEAALEPHWRAAREAGEPATTDPFARLFAPQRAADFVGNRAAMRALPAAREALNQYLMGSRSM